MGAPINQRPSTYEKSVWSQSGLAAKDERARQDAKLGSQVLREACLDLFQRVANSNNIPMDEAMARHLGRHAPVNSIPGTERGIRGQAAQRALAA